LCNRGSTIEEFYKYPVTLAGSNAPPLGNANPAVHLQAKCRQIGESMDLNRANCEKAIDQFIKKNLTLTLLPSTSNGADLNL
jgi:hypothetical protein